MGLNDARDTLWRKPHRLHSPLPGPGPEDPGASERPVLYLLPEPRPLLPQEGALLLFRPEGSLFRHRAASGFLLPEPYPEVEAFCQREGLGLALYPPWLQKEEVERALASRLFALGPGLALAGLLDLLLKLPQRPLLEVLHQATGLALAQVAPWGEVLAFAGPVPPQHPKEAGEGRGYLALEAGEGVLVAYGEEALLRRALGLLQVASRLLRLRAWSGAWRGCRRSPWVGLCWKASS